MSQRQFKGVIRDRTDKFKSFRDVKTTTKSSGGSTIDNSREIRFKALSSSIMKIAKAEEIDLEQPNLKANHHEREVSMNSDEPSLADDEGTDVRDRKIDDDELDTSYQPPFWILCKDEIDQNMKRIEGKCKHKFKIFKSLIFYV